jgi:hypothetical protein
MKLWRLFGTGTGKPSPAKLRRSWRGLAILLVAWYPSLALLSPAWVADDALNPSFDPGTTGLKRFPSSGARSI